MNLFSKFGVLHERIDMLSQNFASLDQRHFWMKRTVGPNFQSESIVVRLLSDSGFFY
jgi:hypothetical protein